MDKVYPYIYFTLVMILSLKGVCTFFIRYKLFNLQFSLLFFNLICFNFKFLIPKKYQFTMILYLFSLFKFIITFHFFSNLVFCFINFIMTFNNLYKLGSINNFNYECYQSGMILTYDNITLQIM